MDTPAQASFCRCAYSSAACDPPTRIAVKRTGRPSAAMRRRTSSRIRSASATPSINDAAMAADYRESRAARYHGPAMKIYTKTGDDGTTGLLGAARVSKSDARIDCYGNIDELNAAIGWAAIAGDAPLAQLLRAVQSQL